MILFFSGFIVGALVALVATALYVAPIADELREELAKLKVELRHK